MRCFQMPGVWLSMLLLAILLVPEQAQALVCQQRGELPAVESAHAYAGELPLHYKDHEHDNSRIWHIHMDIPIECAWSDEKGGELAAEQQSSQPLYVYLDPAQQDTALNSMTWDISVDHGRSIYPVGKRRRVLKSDQHMPAFSLLRICDHHDEWGCRHWRNAPSQDYRSPTTFLLPIDLYLPHPLPQTSFVGRLFLQVGGHQEPPDVRSRLNVPVHFPGSNRPQQPSATKSTDQSSVPLRKILHHSLILLDNAKQDKNCTG